MSNADSSTEIERIGVDCHIRAVDAFGTAFIFKERSQILKRDLDRLTYVGFISPISVGLYVMIFSPKDHLLENIIVIAGIAAAIQTAVSLWAVVKGWLEDYQYCLESNADNLNLAQQFKELGSQTIAPPLDWKERYFEIKGKDSARQSNDSKRAPSERELRRGHRAGLRQMQRACAGCQLVPLDMKSTDCNVCGSFNHDK